jgi:diguanylate cyclase (GGDEF)-like protein
MSARTAARTLPAWLARGALAAVGLAGVLGLAVPGPALAAGSLPERLAAARKLAAVDPHAAVRALGVLRAELPTGQALDLRLAIDEAECRVQTDLEGAQGLAAAEAGLALAGPEPAGAARTPWLRLRACRAEMLLDMGERERGVAELQALLALPADTLAPEARGMALLVRGVHRSRSGDLNDGQQDLLAACELLKDSPLPADKDLCGFHLANHYRRTGDTEEALRLVQALHERAHSGGATYDDSVYAYGLAQLLQQLKRWTEALQSYQESLAATQRLKDVSGQAYAEHGLAQVLLKLNRADEALPHAQQALALVDYASDQRQGLLRSITLAEALAALDRSTEANAVLDKLATAVRERQDELALADWLRVRARTLQQLGHWQAAYAALDEARALEQHKHEQQLSEQSARLRMQFNRARDAEELAALRQLNEQGQRLRQTQAVALVLFMLLLAALLVVAVRKVRQARLLHNLASTDELTGLPNRRALFAYLGQQLAQTRASGVRLSVLAVDVDHFKRINDSHGHAVGDLVLRHVAQVLAGGLRERDRLGRVGGEEFVAVLPDAELAAAEQVAERMRAALAGAPLQVDAVGELRVTVSIGVARARAGESPEAMLARADEALYGAKNAGRDTVMVSPPGAQSAY